MLKHFILDPYIRFVDVLLFYVFLCFPNPISYHKLIYYTIRLIIHVIIYSYVNIPAVQRIPDDVFFFFYNYFIVLTTTENLGEIVLLKRIIYDTVIQNDSDYYRVVSCSSNEYNDHSYLERNR